MTLIVQCAAVLIEDRPLRRTSGLRWYYCTISSSATLCPTIEISAGHHTLAHVFPSRGRGNPLAEHLSSITGHVVACCSMSCLVILSHQGSSGLMPPLTSLRPPLYSHFFMPCPCLSLPLLASHCLFSPLLPLLSSLSKVRFSHHPSAVCI
jgi:hypothetical protein